MENISGIAASLEKQFDAAVSLRQQGRFGDAVNAFMAVAEEADVEINRPADPTGDPLDSVVRLKELRDSSLASVELIRRITGFVNKDLMNP